MGNEKRNKEYCGVKFHSLKLLTKATNKVIDDAGKRNHMVKVILPKGEDSFIIVFENRIHRDGFVTAITPYIYGEVEYSYVNNIKLED